MNVSTQYSVKKKTSKNFIKENVNNIKQLQRLLDKNHMPRLKLQKDDKFRNFPMEAIDYYIMN